MKNKNGITSEALVKIILTILGFIVVVLILTAFKPQELTDREICYQSVALRGSKIGQLAVPLNCRTEIACLTRDGSCEQMTARNIIQVKDSDELYNALAERMMGCWSMFGEGKINYVGQEFNENLYCSICSQIGLDDSINFFPNNEVDKKQIYYYLATHGSGVSDGMKEKSILEYLLGLDKSSDIEDALAQNNSNFGKMTIGKQYFIMMGAFTKDNEPAKWAIGIGSVAAGVAITIVTAGGGGVVLPLIVGGLASGGGYLLGTAVEGESGTAFLSPTIIEANSEDFEKLKCVDVNTLS